MASLLNLGFLVVVQENGAYVGGYLVVNSLGRPLEFRLSSAVQPNKVQQVLYAGTLAPYVCGELIGKTLVEKAGVPVRLVVTTCEHALDLLFRERELLHGRGFLRRRGLSGRHLLGLRQRLAIGYDGHRGREAGDAQRDGDGTNELTHGSLLGWGQSRIVKAGLRTDFEMNGQ